MTHDEAYAELDAVAFDLLGAKERDTVMAHVEHCAGCRAELDARRATVAGLAFAAPLATDSASRSRIRDRLTTRAHANQPTSTRTVMQPTPTTPLLFPTGPSTAPAPGRRLGFSAWLAVAAGVMLLMSGGLFAVTVRERDDMHAELASEALQGQAARRRIDSLFEVVAARDSVIAGLTGRDVVMMTLTSSAAKESYARVFWNRTRNSWTMIAHNMPELEPGRAYQLWLITGRTKISAGTFVPRQGEALMMVDLPLTERLTAVAITDEPEGGVPQPTGPTVIAAQTIR